MAALVIISILLTRNLQVEPENISKRQLALETVIGVIQDFFKDILGEKGKMYIPYLMSVAIYIGVANLIGILGFKPPTKDMNVTAALAIMSIVLIEFAGIHAKGGKKWCCRSTSWKSSSDRYPFVCDYSVTYWVPSLS